MHLNRKIDEWGMNEWSTVFHTNCFVSSPSKQCFTPWCPRSWTELSPCFPPACPPKSSLFSSITATLQATAWVTWRVTWTSWPSKVGHVLCSHCRGLNLGWPSVSSIIVFSDGSFFFPRVNRWAKICLLDGSWTFNTSEPFDNETRVCWAHPFRSTGVYH